MADEYRRFWITSSDAVEREILLAVAFEAGAEGAEEVEAGGSFRACIYANPERIEQVRRGLADIAASSTQIDAAEDLPDVDWSTAWREGLDAICISPRLVIRPPFIERPLEPGEREVVIDPGQAFGTGGHASTRLCLEWIDVLGQDGDLERVLDVGTGSGVLALAALALGAKHAIGFDLDPVAIDAARAASRENGWGEHAHFFAGPIEALGRPAERFPLVLANLLKQEMLPIATQIAERVSASGRLVLAGLLEEDVVPVCARFEQEGLHEVGRRGVDDSTGRWIGLCLAFKE